MSGCDGVHLHSLSAMTCITIFVLNFVSYSIEMTMA